MEQASGGGNFLILAVRRPGRYLMFGRVFYANGCVALAGFDNPLKSRVKAEL
jgi:hypothetical protein